jgi:hypothetical protein
MKGKFLWDNDDINAYGYHKGEMCIFGLDNLTFIIVYPIHFLFTFNPVWLKKKIYIMIKFRLFINRACQ